MNQSLYWIFCVVFIARSLTQTTNWMQYSIAIPRVSQGNDLLIILNKSINLESVLLIGGLQNYPVFEYISSCSNWKVKYDYEDFESWYVNSDSSILRISYGVASKINSFYLGVYKNTNSSLQYSFSYNFIPPSNCQKPCIYGICLYGACVCINSMHIGYSCSVYPSILSANNEYSISVSSFSWKFYLIDYINSASLNADIKDIQSDLRIFDTRSDDSSILPSMLNYLYEYTPYYSSTSKLNFQLQMTDLEYWVWGMYCNSNYQCLASVRFYDSSSNSQSYMWIIISSIIALVIVCIATPILIKIALKIRRRSSRRVVPDSYNPNKERLRIKYPELKYEGKRDAIPCTICLEDFCDKVNIRKLNCHHIYHSKCIDEWCSTNTLCPLCKQDIFEEKSLSLSNLDN